MQQPQDKRKGRRMLVFLLVLFALPPLSVLLMYQFDWRPGGSSHGHLVSPPRVLQLPTLHDLQGNEFRPEQWKSKWSLVAIAPDGCPEECQQQVYLQRQIHVSLNKEIERVQRFLIVPAQTQHAQLQALQQRYPDLIILSGTESAALVQQFDLPGQPVASAGQAYLVDPLGNLIMSYPQGYDPKGLREDMTRLLKYSWVG